MAYQINKTDGTIVTSVPDGQIDQESTDLTLIGKNFSGFGEPLNENFVKLLENFADTSRPTNPLRGQIWFDTSELKLKVYTGTEFVPVSSATVSNSQPSVLGVGDLWFNNVEKQLLFFDGEKSVVVAPAFARSQGKSGVQVETILDSQNQSKVITSLYTNGVLIGIFSKDRFIPRRAIDGFSEDATGAPIEREIVPGFNVGSYQARTVDPETGLSINSPLIFNVTAENSRNLGNIPASQYLRKDTSNSVSGLLEIRNDLGLVIGGEGLISLTSNNGDFVISNSKRDRNVILEVNNNDVPETAVEIITTNRTINFYPDFENGKVNIGGDLTINGNLTVTGLSSIVQETTIEVEDRAIILAKPTEGSPSDVGANEGGIILKGDTDKIILWSRAGDPLYPTMPLKSFAWNFSEHINLASGRFFYINGRQLIRDANDGKFALTDEIVALDGVASIGKQNVLNIGPGEITSIPQLRLENNKISTPSVSAQDLILEPQRNVVLNNSPRITGLSEPIDSQDAATKEYVDNAIESRDIALSLDLTPDKDDFWIIEQVLNNIAPTSQFRNGTTARIVCTKLVNQSTQVTPIINTTTASFVTDLSGSTQDAVVEPVTSNTLTVPAQEIISLSREIRVFRIIQESWVSVPAEEIILS